MFCKKSMIFLSSIIHIIIRTIKCFFVTFNIVVTITMLFIFCKNHTFIPRMRQQRMHFIVYITVSLSLSLNLTSIIHIKWFRVSHLSLLLFGMLQKRNSSFFHIQIIYHNNSSLFKPFAFEGRCFKRSKIAQRIYTFITGQIDRFWLYRNSQSCQ